MLPAQGRKEKAGCKQQPGHTINQGTACSRGLLCSGQSELVFTFP